jgi:hypothetical protein
MMTDSFMCRAQTKITTRNIAKSVRYPNLPRDDLGKPELGRADKGV